MSELVLYLPYPPTANNLFPTGKCGKRFPSAEYKAWQAQASMMLMSSTPNDWRGKTLPPPYRVVYEFRRPDNRRRDVANLEKAPTDLLVKHGILRDDCLIDELTLRWVKDVPWEGRVTIRSLA